MNRDYLNSKTPEAAVRDERTLFIARVFLGVCLSILVHVIVSVVTYEIGGYIDPRKNPQRPSLVEWIEPSDLKKDDWDKQERLIVRQVDLPKDMTDLSVKPIRRFLSEDRQTVKQETRTLNSGITENRMAQDRPTDVVAKQAAAESARAREELAEEEVLPNSIFREGLGDVAAKISNELRKPKLKGNGDSEFATDLLLPSDPRRNRGISTTGEALPSEIQIGDFTALNTDRFVFYTYYARTDERIRNPWVRYVKAALYGGGDIPDGSGELVTKLEIVLDREGRYLRTILHQGSGSSDLDRAAALAFHEAKQIPHPPREMVKEDGTIRLLYAFHVERLPAVARAKIPVRASGTANAADAKTE